MRYRQMAIAVATLAAAVITACGGGGVQPFPYANCGDGTIQPGEQCDDGRANCDTCACTTICQNAFCGDGFVYIGVEQCDSNNLNRQTCTSLGFAGGTLSCRSCRFMTAECGPAFTPTPAVPTPTPTATPRPTSTPGGTCDPAGRVPVTVNVAASQSIRSIGIALDFPTGVVNLPSADLTGRITNRPPGTQLTASLSDSTLDATVSRPLGTFPAGRLFVVDFDHCAGTDLPQPTDFTCTVTECSASDCRCFATLP